MSRIHDALKKAEAEKIGSAVSNSSPLDISSTPLHLEQEERTAGRMSHAVALEDNLADPVYGGMPSGFNVESLANCRKCEWALDPERIVFTGVDQVGVAGVEEFRTLRSRLFQLREKQELKTIVISSALPGEGKTFVSANLAHVLVRHRTKRVLLIDADLRKPSLHRLMGADEKPGLSDVLNGDLSEIEAIQRGVPENLFFLPAGTPMTNPAELVSGDKLRDFLNRVGDVFDWIVIDSPPVIPVADAVQIAGCSDGVLLVIQSGSTPFDLAQRARSEFSKHRLLGVVLNRIPAASLQSSYYYHGYGQDVAKRSE